MALNKVKIKNTESIRLVTGDKTEISSGSSFNGIEIVGVTNGIADAGDVTNKTSLTIDSTYPGISFSVSSTGITAEIILTKQENPVEDETFNRIAGTNHLYYFTTISGALNIPEASAAGEFIFNADNREISIHALDLNNRPAGKQSFSAAAEIFNGKILASRTDASGENVYEEHTITYNNPSYNGTKFDVEDVTITNGATLESWYGGTRPVLVSVIPDTGNLGATEIAARTAFVFPDGCSAESIVVSWNGMTCEVTFDHYVADINGLTGAIDTSGLTFNFAGVSASGDITTNKLIFADGTDMSTASSGSGGVTSINDVVASLNGLTGAIDTSGLTFNFAGVSASGDITTNKLIFADGTDMSTASSGSGGVTSINDVVASFNGLTGAVTLSAGTGITLTGTELNVDAVTSFNGSSGDVTLTAGTGITLTGSELNVDAVTSINGISGAIDTSGLTFNFAGLSASGDLTVGGRVVANIIQSPDNYRSRYGYSDAYTWKGFVGNDTVVFQFDSNGIHAVSGRVKANTFVEAGTYVHAGTGISLDSFGITFADGTYQASAASGSGGVTSINDVVASLNGLTGAIDTSGLTFNFAGLSASGDLTVGGVSTFNDTVNIAAGKNVVVNLNSKLVSASGNNGIKFNPTSVEIIPASSASNSALFSSTGVVFNKMFTASGINFRAGGISMDTFGITFPDGTYQDTASSGSGGVTSINDVVASLNGLTGAIDTSGLTFNFAGLSASGDLTVLGGVSSGGGGTFDDVSASNLTSRVYNNDIQLDRQNNMIMLRPAGSNGKLSISSVEFQTNVALNNFNAGVVRIVDGITLTGFGITFADGTYQDSASHNFVGAGFDGQGATLQANTVLVPVEQAGTIVSATIVGDVSGSLSVSIFKYGVTSDTADLGASAEVGTISLLEKIIIRNTTEITGTTADIAEGDILAFSLGATAAGAPIIASQKATCKLKIKDS